MSAASKRSSLFLSAANHNYVLCHGKKSSNSTAYCLALEVPIHTSRGSLLQDWIVRGFTRKKSRLIMTETKRAFITSHGMQSGRRSGSTTEARTPEHHGGPRFLSSVCSPYSDISFCLQSCSVVNTKWLPPLQRISSLNRSKMQKKDKFQHISFYLSQKHLGDRPSGLQPRSGNTSKL